MKAIVYTEYGSPDVLTLGEVATPTPKANEILVRVQASTVKYGDLLARNLRATHASDFNMPGMLWPIVRLSFGLKRPRNPVLGSEFAGVVEAAGPGVTQFKPGDAVFGYRGAAMGAYAEYVTMPETGPVAHKPEGVTFEQAASSIYGAIVALGLLRAADVQPGQQVLINGASGGIGAAAVQLAVRKFGAAVTAVGGAHRKTYMRALGARHVLDYRQDDFTTQRNAYDVVIDVLGRVPFHRGRRALKPGGRYVYASFKLRQVGRMLATRLFGQRKALCVMVSENHAAAQEIAGLLDAGTLSPIIDQCFPMAQAAAAHRYAESGQHEGNIVISVAT